MRWIEQEVLDGDEVVLKAVTGGNWDEILKNYYMPAVKAQLNSSTLLLRGDLLEMRMSGKTYTYRVDEVR